MTRTDTTVVGALVVLLAVLTGLVGIPALQATSATPSAVAGPSDGPARRAYREGVVGHPVSISPLTARTQADRDLVALAVLRAWSATAPTARSCPTSPSAGRSTTTGRVWTFELCDPTPCGTTANRSPPMMSSTRSRRSRTRRTPDPGRRPGPRSTVRAVSPTVVTFTLATPLGGFLQAATQPIAPAHLLGEVPVSLLPDHPFGQPAGRVGSVRAVHARSGQGRVSSRPSQTAVPPIGAVRSVGRAHRLVDDRAADPPTRTPDAVPLRHRDALLRRSPMRSPTPTATASSMRRPGCPPSTAAELASREATAGCCVTQARR